MKTIEEGNKLIVEFMGYKFKNSLKFWCRYPLDDNSFLKDLGWVGYNRLKFHSDWNWLMPVVEKLEKLKHPVYIHSNCCTIYEKAGKQHGVVMEEYGETKIEATWKCIVRFLTFESLINNSTT